MANWTRRLSRHAHQTRDRFWVAVASIIKRLFLCGLGERGGHLFDLRVDAAKLTDAERRRHLVQAVVITQPVMLKPGAHLAASLVAQTAAEPRDVVRVGDDDAAFAGRDLFVGIESEGCRVAKATEPRSLE